jgi:hypothetical protein
MASYTIGAGVTRDFSDIDGGGTQVANLDDVTVSYTGKGTADAAWAGADGSRAVVITVNGIYEQEAGVTVKIGTHGTKEMYILESGQARILGTAANPCAIIMTDIADSANNIYLFLGGYFYAQYTAISDIYNIECRAGIVELHNCTVTGRTPLRSFNGFGVYRVFNSTITSTVASQYIFGDAVSTNAFAVNSKFYTLTDDYLGFGTRSSVFTFAGCTYQGAPIAANDFRLTTQDIDIRIYEASVATESTPLSGVNIGVSHPSIDSLGMLYDSTNYVKIPAYLSYPTTSAAGTATIYTLQKSAYWSSGTAVNNRLWESWSDSAKTETGDNQKYTFTFSKVGYVSQSGTAWSGANPAAVTLAAISGGGAGGRMVQGMV